MTLAEYELQMEAFQLRRIQTQEDIALQAWFNQQVQATSGGKHPKPKFTSFKKFFDAQAAIDDVRSDFEPWYKTSKRNEMTAGQLIAKRQKEFWERRRTSK